MMFTKIRQLQSVFSAVLIMVLWLTPIAASGQDLVAYSSISTGSSVFVFRAARSARRVAVAKPVRTQTARLQTVNRIRKQYETIARANPKPQREKVVAPNPQLMARNALSADKGSKLLAGVGEYYIQQSDLDNAIDTFREAMTLDTTNVAAKLGFSEALALKGNDKLEKNLPTEAKALFLEALQSNPKNSAAYFGLGEVYSELDQTTEAIASYEKSLENDPNLTEIYVPLGILYFQTNDITKADDMLTKAIAAAPERAETQYFYGLVRSAQNRNDEAVTAFQKARTIDPNYAEAFYRAGDTLVALKRPAEAVPEFQKAVELKKDYFEAYFGLGGALYDVGNYAESVAAYANAKRIKNNSWETYAGLGDANLKAGKFDDAAANYKLAITFLMQNKDFNKDTAADLYSKTGFAIGQQCPLNQAKFVPCQWPAAIAALEKAVELGGKPFDYTNLGWAYFNASRLDRDKKMPADQQAKLQLAKVALQKALDANPPGIENPLQNFGVVQNDLGDYRGAIETFNKVIVLQPDWAFTRYALGAAYFMLADYENAAAAFRAALDKNPNYFTALSSLGSLEVKRKNLKEANKILDQLKLKDPEAARQLEQEIRLSGFKMK
ncbi:MAG: tetratricopeptide repeat protein [Pyrinomonadaceae bacterium]